MVRLVYIIHFIKSYNLCIYDSLCLLACFYPYYKANETGKSLNLNTMVYFARKAIKTGIHGCQFYHYGNGEKTYRERIDYTKKLLGCFTSLDKTWHVESFNLKVCIRRDTEKVSRCEKKTASGGALEFTPCVANWNFWEEY